MLQAQQGRAVLSPVLCHCLKQPSLIVLWTLDCARRRCTRLVFQQGFEKCTGTGQIAVLPQKAPGAVA